MKRSQKIAEFIDNRFYFRPCQRALKVHVVGRNNGLSLCGATIVDTMPHREELANKCKPCLAAVKEIVPDDL